MIRYEVKRRLPTLKNEFVEPQQYVPYLILVCLARSSAEFTGDDILDAVKKAGEFDIYYFILCTFENIPARLAV